MTRRPTAVVANCYCAGSTGWHAIIKPDGKPLEAVPVSEPHPEGTRLTLVDGEWRKL